MLSNDAQNYNIGSVQSDLYVKTRIELPETPKAHTLKRSDETSANVTVAKVEKSCGMEQGQILNFMTMGNRQPSPEQGEGSTTILRGSRDKRPEVVRSERSDEDIVCAHTKV